MKAHLINVLAVAVISAALLVLSPSAAQVNAQTATQAATPGAPPAPTIIRTAALVLSAQDGVPSGVDKANWSKAFGAALVSAGSSGNDTIDVELAGLVPNGVYSVWWVNATPSMSMGPLGKAPTDSFTADAHGNGAAMITVPSANTYQQLVVVYQADGKTHGVDGPGKMGSEAFTQLSGAFPNASSSAAMGAGSVTKATTLQATTFNGIPPKADKTMWTKAIGVAAMTMGSSGTDSVVLRLGRLVPNGLYTAWWTNTTPSRATGIFSKPPGDPINADADGYAMLTFEVPSTNNYQRLGVFFQADGKMPGIDTPGAMGSVAYIALLGGFPGPAGVVAPVNAQAPRPTPTAAATK